MSAGHQTSLGDLAEIVMGQAPPGAECNKDGRGIVFVKAGEFDERRPLVREWTTKPLKLARSGDVLVCVVGATAGKINEAIDCAIGRSVAAVRPASSKVASPYLYHFLATQVLSLRAKSQGLAQGVITREMLQDLGMPLPPLAEQRRIAEVLDRAEALRAKRRAALAQLDTLTQAIFLDLFGDPIRHPEEGLPTVGTCIRDGIILEIQDGNHGERHPKVEDFVEEGIPFVTANCLSDGELDLASGYCLPPRWLKTLRIGFAKTDDVLLSHKGTVGSTAIVPNREEPVILSPQVTYYRLNPEKLCSVYLRAYFQTDTFQAKMKNEAQQTTRAYLGITRQLDLPMSVPPLQLQQEFARQQTAVDRLKTAHRASLAELDALFAALQHRAFRGEL